VPQKTFDILFLFIAENSDTVFPNAALRRTRIRSTCHHHQGAYGVNQTWNNLWQWNGQSENIAQH
jgi:hypothetical protein